jgi:hypothetical protein
MKTHFKQGGRLWIGAIAFCGLGNAMLSTSVEAFSISRSVWIPGFIVRQVSDPNHENITAQALTGYTPFKLSNGSDATFSAEALSVITSGNVDNDLAANNIPELHADEERLLGSFRYVLGQRARIARAARSGDFTEAQEDLGSALHTIQDFYAHTSWIEGGHTGLAPLTQLTDPPEFSNIIGNQTTCTHFGLVPAAPFAPLTSGWFQAIDASGVSGWSTDPADYGLFEPSSWPHNKCVHGSPFLQSNDSEGFGLNKDTVLRANFPTAYSLAVQASVEYVKAVVADLGDRKGAICGLLGQDQTLCGTVIPIVNSGFEAVALADGAFVGNIPGWTIGAGVGFNPPVGTFNPTAAQFPGGIVPEGQNIAYSKDGTISQVLSTTLSANTTYILKVDIGHRLDNPVFPGYSVQLRVVRPGMDDIVLATESALSPGLGSFQTSTLSYTANASDASLGMNLKILFDVTPVGDFQVFFDNVRLTATQ